MEPTFAGRVIEWRGPSPFYFVPVPEEECEAIREVAALATYGLPAAAQGRGAPAAGHHGR